MAETPSPTPTPGSEGPPKETPATPAAPLTAEEKLARLAAVRAKNAAAAAAKAAGGAAPAAATPAAPAAAATPAAPAAAAAPAAPAEPAKPLTAEEKKARLEAVRAKNAAAAAAKAAGKPGDTGVPATGAPASTPAAAHLASTTAGAPQAVAPAAKPAAAAAKTPGVPLPPPPQLTTRRTFVEWAFAAWVVFFAWLAGVGHMFLRFMFPNVLYESDPKFIAGKKSDFPESPKVYELFKTSQAVWIARLNEEGQDRLVALSTVCTHLGCTPNWLEAEQKYKCPCHGSGYYLDGVNFEGPTPRPLERFRIFQDAAGNIVVDKAKKYRKDLAQWNENESYLPLA